MAFVTVLPERIQPFSGNALHRFWMPPAAVATRSRRTMVGERGSRTTERLDADEALTQGGDDGLRPVDRVELAARGLHMFVDSALGDAENLARLPG